MDKIFEEIYNKLENITNVNDKKNKKIELFKHYNLSQIDIFDYKKYDTKLRQRKFNLKLQNPENKELKDKISEQKKLNKQKLLENPEIKEKYRLKNIRDAKKYRDNEKLIYNNLLEKEKKENAFNTIKYAILSKIARNKFLLLKINNDIYNLCNSIVKELIDNVVHNDIINKKKEYRKLYMRKYRQKKREEKLKLLNN